MSTATPDPCRPKMFSPSMSRKPPSVSTKSRLQCKPRDLALGFGSASVLSDINVDIAKGEITALIGPTGSGKTTSSALSTA